MSSFCFSFLFFVFFFWKVALNSFLFILPELYPTEKWLESQLANAVQVLVHMCPLYIKGCKLQTTGTYTLYTYFETPQLKVQWSDVFAEIFMLFPRYENYEHLTSAHKPISHCNIFLASTFVHWHTLAHIYEILGNLSHIIWHIYSFPVWLFQKS